MNHRECAERLIVQLQPPATYTSWHLVLAVLGEGLEVERQVALEVVVESRVQPMAADASRQPGPGGGALPAHDDPWNRGDGVGERLLERERTRRSSDRSARPA